MTNTNHNILTLTIHVAKSVNKMAGKVDAKIYGNTVVPSKPVVIQPVEPSIPFDWNIIWITGGLILLVTTLVYYYPKIVKKKKLNI